MFLRILSFAIIFIGSLFLSPVFVFGAGIAFIYFFYLPLEVLLLGVVMDSLMSGFFEGFFLVSFAVLIIIQELLRHKTNIEAFIGFFFFSLISFFALIAVLVVFKEFTMIDIFAFKFLIKSFLVSTILFTSVKLFRALKR